MVSVRYFDRSMRAMCKYSLLKVISLSFPFIGSSWVTKTKPYPRQPFIGV